MKDIEILKLKISQSWGKKRALGESPLNWVERRGSNDTVWPWRNSYAEYQVRETREHALESNRMTPET